MGIQQVAYFATHPRELVHRDTSLPIEDKTDDGPPSRSSKLDIDEFETVSGCYGLNQARHRFWDSIVIHVLFAVLAPACPATQAAQTKKAGLGPTLRTAEDDGRI